MNELQLFNFKGDNVRMLVIDGEPWWVLKDVCNVLEISNGRNVIARLDEDEKSVHQMDTNKGLREAVIINEPGLYNVILRSEKPKAKEFKRWITHEVLPSIRKTGTYTTPTAKEEIMSSPEALATMVDNWREERSLRLAAEAKIEEDKPKVILAEAITASETSIPIGDLAKLIYQSGYDIGRNGLFFWMRENGYLIKQPASFNMPTQRSVDLGLLEIQEAPVRNINFGMTIVKATYVTGKGQQYFINKFSNMPKDIRLMRALDNFIDPMSNEQVEIVYES